MSVVTERSAGSGLDWRPFAIRTSESATQGVYGLILATAVIAISRESDPSDAGQAAISMLVTALVFWLAHLYAHLLGRAVSRDGRLTRAAVARAARENWSLVEVAIPLVLILWLGAFGVIPERAALVAATVLALVELAATGAYAAIRQGAGPGGTLLSATIALVLGLFIVLLKVLIH
jgi:multisubunit Na+/H+ antiporter MnhG subunit